MSSVGTVRISGVNLPSHKHIWIALTSLYGIGRTRSKQICQAARVEITTKVNQLSADAVESLRTEIKKYVIEGDLRRKVAANIKRLTDIKCYRGRRHQQSLPMKKRTKTNARTRKGKKRVPKESKK